MDINRIQEQMPNFSSHEEARNWFKDQFKEQFLLRSSDVLDGKKVYFYHMIKDSETYQHYMESFAKPEKHEITNIAPFESYSTIVINEDGEVQFSV